MKWNIFESHVRKIASYRWDAVGSAREINGVNIDCVLELRPDYWILIEITQEESLRKH